ncbi:anaphase-promoting complex subunit 10 [Fusarium albosuccineum]|uniref:Anaphase-promoting complex subunit 10 n=1 Tax=Fusarium albosuccineum TaxID=1237068 RepID=A0A8H4LMG1_9HYPO|nr:anaphase-promoting complex subunit 10 [Fusarium albosuccineum]
MPALRSTQPSRRHNPITPGIKRRPLGQLAIDSHGNLKQKRKRTLRPIPALSKENGEAVLSALHHLQRTSDLVDRLGFPAEAIYHTAHWRRDFVNALYEVDDLCLAVEIMQHYGITIEQLDEQGMEIDELLAAYDQQPSRLSMPLISSDDSASESEPEISILGRARPGGAAAPAAPEIPSAFGNAQEVDEDQDEVDDEALSPEQYEAEDTSIEEEEEPAEEAQEIAPLIDPATAGLKEISNLARFTVSSHKPGNGVEALKSDDTAQFWQSDGPQPHKLTMYFTKRVSIRDIRFYVNHHEDESYTPTKVVFKAGTSENNLIEFATMTLDSPTGWQQVPVAGAGGDSDGNTLVAWVLQMQILENHQNGKDTHLRGIKIYSFDNDSAHGPGRDGNPVDDAVSLVVEAVNRAEGGATLVHDTGATRFEPGEGGLTIPDFMREPEIR